MRFRFFLRITCRLAIAAGLFAGTAAHAQTPYNRIDVGTQLDARGIGLGFFAKPIPLPAGEWTVVGKHEQQLNLSGGTPDGPSSTPRIMLTLRNTARQGNPLFAIIVGFTPDSIPINWGNQPCTTNNPLGLVDDFGLKSSDMLYVCARADAVYDFKETIRNVKTNTNEWMKTYLRGLAPYADDVPANVVLVDVYGNKFLGKWMGITFLLRADANADVNPAYRDHILSWMHATGKSWTKVINNDAATLPTLESFWTGK
nr:hypothetical protein [uncultured Rhodoferax sp.]